jgi:hypothetical protein
VRLGTLVGVRAVVSGKQIVEDYAIIYADCRGSLDRRLAIRSFACTTKK